MMQHNNKMHPHYLGTAACLNWPSHWGSLPSLESGLRQASLSGMPWALFPPSSKAGWPHLCTFSNNMGLVLSDFEHIKMSASFATFCDQLCVLRSWGLFPGTARKYPKLWPLPSSSIRVPGTRCSVCFQGVSLWQFLHRALVWGVNPSGLCVLSFTRNTHCFAQMMGRLTLPPTRIMWVPSCCFQFMSYYKFFPCPLNGHHFKRLPNILLGGYMTFHLVVHLSWTLSCFQFSAVLMRYLLLLGAGAQIGLFLQWVPRNRIKEGNVFSYWDTLPIAALKVWASIVDKFIDGAQRCKCLCTHTNTQGSIFTCAQKSDV